MVIDHPTGSLLKPCVKAFFATQSGLHMTPEIIDLARPSVTETTVCAEDPDRWGMKNLERFLTY